ncbi:MAG: bifunctional YncE family protein/alkaline phosphatase family protein [Polyangiaceae bacterium]|nr:bifunctional YncE family protein/alkaline phosphatase family protein [Polyangiaceae bacterium]
MRAPFIAAVLTPLLALLTASCGADDAPGRAAGAGGAPADGGDDGGGGFAGAGARAGEDPYEFYRRPTSCAYVCPPESCSELDTPYACQNLGLWNEIPHAEACPAWRGRDPAPVEGRCTASAPSGEALAYAGPVSGQPGTWVLPDGRRITPAGAEWIFSEAELLGGITTGMLVVPGTSLLVLVDSGIVDHAVRAVDASRVGAGDPVTGRVEFQAPSTLNWGLAFVPPDLVYVATDDGVVQALSLDTATGALARDDARSISLPPAADGEAWYVAGLAASPDGKRLFVSSVDEKALLVYDVDPTSANVRQLLGQATLPKDETFGVWVDPLDTTGTRAWVTLWAARKLVEVDATDPTSPMVARTFDTGKNPQGVAFLDARWLVVGNDLGDSLSVVDRSDGSVTTLPVDPNAELLGLEPSALAFDTAASRLYVALSGVNAIAAYDVDLATAPPTITPLGRVPTAWWPSAVGVLGDGRVVVGSMRGHGTGPNPVPLPIGDGEISDLMRGGVQVVQRPSAAALVDGEARVEANGRAARSGAPEITCPAGADDFPVPATNDAGPSRVIDHVFIIVRENKNFDSIFGDLPGVEGRADIMLKADPADVERIWKNMRTLARTFTVGDNYYTSAVQSTQGHVWVTHGRTNDFNERTWAVSGAGRDSRGIPGGGLIDVGKPEEGSMFDWLGRAGIAFDMLGEGVGIPAELPAQHNPIDLGYPGGPVQNIGYNDLEKACHTAGRLRVLCDLGQVVYMTLTNDHAFGVGDDRATPEIYCAVNDEATGMMVDAITHSPVWPRSLIIITQDDPLQGGEHIDSHRTPYVLVSPWVKRGYVTKGHLDASSNQKLLAHLLGLEYPNHQVATAALPLDAFTSTPDFTPWTYTPRQWPLECGAGGTREEKELTDSWEFEEVDEQPGLSAQVWRWMRRQQLTKLTPRQIRGIEQRWRARQREAARQAPRE